MTIFIIDIHHDLHTCPGSATPHPFHTRQEIVGVTPAGRCRAPITIRIGDTTAEIPCWRHEPADRQCGACRVLTWVRTVTVTDHGYQGPDDLNPQRTTAA